MNKVKIAAGSVAFLASLSALANVAMAKAGQPVPWQMGFQDMVTPVGEQGMAFHHGLLILITVISVFVLGLLIIVMVRFNAKANPVPSKTTHNTLLEVAWTTVPVLILMVTAVFSFRLLYHQNDIPDTDMTIKITGHQWYWSVAYPDNGDIAFDINIVDDADLKPGQPRLLTTDNIIVLPVNTKIKVLVTADDVIHSFAVPSFYVKVDAIPGRINETWFEALKMGDFYGQCSELCGIRHGFMPLHVRIVSKEDFAKWVKHPTIAGLSEPKPITGASKFEVASRHVAGTPATTR